MNRLLLALVMLLAGCLPDPPERPAEGDDDDVVDDDDGVDDDDDVVDDDDSAADDDDSVPVLLDLAVPPGGLCAAPGRSTSTSFTAFQCTGPSVGAPGVSSSSSFTAVVGAARLLQVPE